MLFVPVLSAHLKFRNYVPHDRALRKHHVRKAPANIVSELEEQLQLEMAIVDDEVCIELALEDDVGRCGALII